MFPPYSSMSTRPSTLFQPCSPTFPCYSAWLHAALVHAPASLDVAPAVLANAGARLDLVPTTLVDVRASLGFVLAVRIDASSPPFKEEISSEAPTTRQPSPRGLVIEPCWWMDNREPNRLRHATSSFNLDKDVEHGQFF